MNTNVFFLGSGVILLLAGGVGTFQGRRLSRYGQHVTGTVVRLDWQLQPNADPAIHTSARICHPVLAFQTLDGRDVQARGRTSTNRPSYEQGQQVPVIYDPRNPARADIDNRAGRSAWIPLLITALGLALVAYAAFRMASGRP